MQFRQGQGFGVEDLFLEEGVTKPVKISLKNTVRAESVGVSQGYETWVPAFAGTTGLFEVYIRTSSTGAVPRPKMPQTSRQC